ncbi:hypothetical protein LFML04_0815 [Leptospirillum ferriphilum ML-04]|uniref:Uncharacterized protein n=1 Tax=Leptospirillum ferriphilum (strain ML-04) TaxID=1048260 RepID=J9Z988_LEPFM|nr:hypothetical protein LFML04_0815 [Leptospirillum ferriphilum ML-04]
MRFSVPSSSETIGLFYWNKTSCHGSFLQVHGTPCSSVLAPARTPTGEVTLFPCLFHDTRQQKTSMPILFVLPERISEIGERAKLSDLSKK